MCSDVFFIFIGIAIGFTHVFADSGMLIDIGLHCHILTWLYLESPIYVYCAETYSVFNQRFAIFLKDCTQDMFLLAYLLDPSMCIWIFPQRYLIPACPTVYYRDGALRLALPPRALFSKRTASSLVLRLIVSARCMLQYEQQRVRSGTKEDDTKLIAQLTGMINLNCDLIILTH
jgi:hypothetical protein